MNILIISGSMPPIKCGVGDYTNLLAKELANNNNVFVLTSKKATKSPYFEVINIINKWSGVSLIKTIIQTIKKYNIDIVQYEFPTSEYKNNSISNYIFLPLLLRLKRIKFVYTLHEFSDNSFISRFVRIPALLFSNKIIIVDERYRRDIKKLCFLVKTSKISLVPIASNIPQSKEGKSEITNLRNNIISKYGVNKIISYFGFINQSKRLDLIFKAMGLLKKDNHLDFVFLIIGDFNSLKCPKEHYDYLCALIKEYNLENNIFITGFLKDEGVGKYIKSSDASILLFNSGVSIRNGSMLAVLQEGVKIITSKPKYHYPLFENEQFLLIDNDINQVKEAIAKIQDSSTVKYEGNYLNWDEVAKIHENIYNELIKKHLKDK